jgi:hypothetical protein
VGRLTIFAKGNLDVRDTLHSLRLRGELVWNGVNEIMRAQHPGDTVRLRHETWTRSDALLAADGVVPPEVAARNLPLGAYPAASQVSTALFDAAADVIVLSIQPDLHNNLLRHRRDGYLFYPEGWRARPAEDQQWLRESFAAEPMLGAAKSMRNLEAIIERIRRRSDAPILVYNASAVAPGEQVHAHEGLGDILSTRIRRFNLALIELSQRTGISIVDVDRIIARHGADRLKLDVLHLTAEGCRLIAEEVVRILEDCGCYAQEAAPCG